MVVRVPRVDPEPVVHGVPAGLRVRPGPLPLRGRQRLEEREARRPDGREDREGGGDRPVVVEPSREQRLVVSRDDRVVLGDQPAQARVRHRLAVGQVVDDLTGGPLP